jgi:hypothetical protein
MVLTFVTSLKINRIKQNLDKSYNFLADLEVVTTRNEIFEYSSETKLSKFYVPSVYSQNDQEPTHLLNLES